MSAIIRHKWNINISNDFEAELASSDFYPPPRFNFHVIFVFFSLRGIDRVYRTSTEAVFEVVKLKRLQVFYWSLSRLRASISRPDPATDRSSRQAACPANRGRSLDHGIISNIPASREPKPVDPVNNIPLFGSDSIEFRT